MVLVIASCGKDGGDGTVSYPTNPTGQNGIDNYIPIAQAIVKLSNTENYAYQKILKYLNPIPTAYAAPIANATVTYTAIEIGSMTIDTSSLVATNNGDTLDLGSLSITAIQANKLKVCGAANNLKCGTAVIRVYTQELVGFETIDGFVNTTDSYGVPVYSGKVTASEFLGLSSVNAAIVQSYTIPVSDRKINLSDFPTPTYLIQSDFSNAGAGNYEMTLIVELALTL